MHAADFSIVLVALVAAAVTGGIGYGFSSITVPVALLVYTGRVLNPALVILELFINGLALLANRRSLRVAFRRVLPLLPGLLPGVIAGSLALAWVDSGLLRILTFAILLPLILLQSAGLRRPIANERAVGLPFGVALGALYGATTISGPPLALFFNNQGLSKDEFRASLGLFRVAESACTVAAYLALGIFTRPALLLSASLAPAVLIGLPLGYLALRRVAAQPFRRACMALDALLVGFGLARTLIERHLVPAPVAWAGLAAVAVLEVLILTSLALGRPGAPAQIAGEAR